MNLTVDSAASVAGTPIDWMILRPRVAGKRGLLARVQRISFAHACGTVFTTAAVLLATVAVHIDLRAGEVLSWTFLPAYAAGMYASRPVRSRLGRYPWGAHAVLASQLLVASVIVLAVLYALAQLVSTVASIFLGVIVFMFIASLFGFGLFAPGAAFSAGKMGGSVIGAAFRYARKLLLDEDEGAVDEEGGLDTHGSARFANENDLRRNQLLGDADLLLGTFHGQLVRSGTEGNLITVAPAGSGKGIGTVLPNLLAYPGPVLVIDPKGENYAVSARCRRDKGQRVVRLDPFELCGPGTDQLNPLELLDPDSLDLADDALSIADMLVVMNPESKDPHWDEKAKSVLRTFIVYAVCHAPPEARDLDLVRKLLFLEPDALEKHLAVMRESDAAHGLVKRGAAEISGMPAQERGSVMSAAQRHTLFLDSPRVARVLGASTFDISGIKSLGDLSIYLVLPADKLGTHAQLFRLWINMAINAVIRDSRPPRHRVLFMLDEMAQLGPMDPLLRAVSLMRGYHMTLWMILQDLSQLRGLYPQKWETFLANSRIQQYFGVSDKSTAEYVSSLTGVSTILTGSMNVTETQGSSDGYSGGSSSSSSYGGSGGSSHSSNSSWNRGNSNSVANSFGVSAAARPLLTPDEVRCLPKNHSLVFVQGVPPIPAVLLDYRNAPMLQGTYDQNPTHTSAALPAHTAVQLTR